MAKTTGLGLLELATVFEQSATGRGGHGRGPLRDHGDRDRRGLHEHSGRPRAGRRGDRLDRREGPPRGHQAGRPALRGERAGRGAGACAWARTPPRCSSPAVPRSTSPPRCSAARRSTSIRSSEYGGVGAVVRPVARLPGGHAAPGDHGVRVGPAAGHRDPLRREGLGSARALVLAQRRRGHRRHLERHPELPRDGAAGELPLLQEHGAGRLPPTAVQLALPGGQLERGNPGVRLPRRARGQHRLAADRPGPGRERVRRRVRPRRHSDGDPSAISRTGDIPATASTATATRGRGSRTCSRRCHSPSKSRLTY